MTAGMPPIRSRNSPGWRRRPSSRSTGSTRARKTARNLHFSRKDRPGAHIRPIMRLLYPQAREIFLVRDPRDTLASALAFNARRGFDGLGRELVETDEQYIGQIRESILSIAQLWRHRSQYGALVRYEDLVRSPTEQIRAMLDALELDSSANIVDSMVKAGKETAANVNAHRTSPGGPLSITAGSGTLNHGCKRSATRRSTGYSTNSTAGRERERCTAPTIGVTSQRRRCPELAVRRGHRRRGHTQISSPSHIG